MRRTTVWRIRNGARDEEEMGRGGGHSHFNVATGCLTTMLVFLQMCPCLVWHDSIYMSHPTCHFIEAIVKPQDNDISFHARNPNLILYSHSEWWRAEQHLFLDQGGNV